MGNTTIPDVKRAELITKAIEIGIPIKLEGTDAKENATAGSAGKKELSELVIFLGKGSSSLANGKFNISETALSGIVGVVGVDEVDDEIIDLDADEFIEVYTDFKNSFELDDPEDAQTELFVEGTFFNALSQVVLTFKYIRYKKAQA